MHQSPSRAATYGTVGAVALVVVIAGVVVRWGPDPAQGPDAARTPAPAGSSSAVASSDAAASSSAPDDERRRTLTTEQLAQLRAARESVTDEEIMRQLRDVAERIASEEPMISPAPPPSDIQPETNRALGYHLMLEFGFAKDQWPALDALWRRESGWNHLAENPSSGAYGIPQSLPASKMATVGADYRTNPETQIRWGLAYIRARYGTPDRAWAHSERRGWY